MTKQENSQPYNEELIARRVMELWSQGRTSKEISDLMNKEGFHTQWGEEIKSTWILNHRKRFARLLVPPGCIPNPNESDHLLRYARLVLDDGKMEDSLKIRVLRSFIHGLEHQAA